VTSAAYPGDVDARLAVTPAGQTASGDHAIVCENLVKIYKVADLEVVALQGLDLVVEQSELIAIVGASGSGKSTLQNILGGVDVPTAGYAEVAGRDLTNLSERERTLYRRRVVGFIWQQTSRNLIPYLTAAENIELPLTIDGVGRRLRRQRVAEMLEVIGLGDRAGHRPDTLSGGEQQRVAVAIALANAPSVLLADEPTGELDSESAAQLFDTLRVVNRELDVTVVVVTHDPRVSEQVQRTIGIRDGRTSTETLRRRERGPAGEERDVAEELAVLDRVGRLQLPREYISALALEHRVRLALEHDHISIRPEHRRDGDRA
jgi:ABC-type lipoprotein export system ATPase subunit